MFTSHLSLMFPTTGAIGVCAVAAAVGVGVCIAAAVVAQHEPREARVGLAKRVDFRLKDGRTLHIWIVRCGGL